MTIFKKDWIRISQYPQDYIPAGGIAVIGCDYATDKDTTVKGFYDPDTGELHIQEVQVTQDKKSLEKKND